MKDNSSQEGDAADITAKDEGNKGTAKDAALPRNGAAPKRQSSGKGLYITAIVLGIIIVLLLAFYIFLAMTHKNPSHAFIAPFSSITRIEKVWTFAGKSAILYPDIKHMLSE